MRFILMKRSMLEVSHMLRWAIVFLVIALVAALFGFGLVAGVAYDAAKILFFVFLVLALVSFISGAISRPPPV